MAYEVDIKGALPASNTPAPKSEPKGPTKGMLHRRPASDCPLCPLWGERWVDSDASTHRRQHVHAEALWDAWGGGRRRDWPRHVMQAAAKLGVACTLAQAKAHFHYHRVEQPMMAKPPRPEALAYEALGLSERQRAVIRCLYRQRLLTTDQLCEVFYRPHYANERSALTVCQRELNALCARHFAYRLYPSEAMAKQRDAFPHFDKQAIWLLGRASRPYIENTEGVTVQPYHYTERANQVAVGRLMHDLRANGIYVRLARALRENGGLVEFGARGTSAAHLLPENWRSDRDLALAFYDRTDMSDDEIRADGFCSLSVQRNSWAGGGQGLPSTQLPFFYEYDRGTKDAVEVARQLLAYHMLALSGKAGERFPDLAVPGYSVPVLMVFSDQGKLRSAQKAFAAVAAEEKLDRGLPILMVAEEDWERDPFADDIVVYAWASEERRFSFPDLLVRSSLPLVASGQALAGQRLRLDPKAARRIRGAYTQTAKQEQREAEVAAHRRAQRKQAREDMFERLRREHGGGRAA